jgi:bacterioferritin B
MSFSLLPWRRTSAADSLDAPHSHARRCRFSSSKVAAVARFTDALNEQVAYEFAASQQYVAIAVYYDRETLPNLAAYFYRQAVEERNHAMMMVQYLLDADTDVVAVPGVEAPQTSFENPVAPVLLALEQERRVTAQIARLAQLAREEVDLVGEQFLHWFLQEQREEVSSMSTLLAIVERAAASNLLLAEEYLARTPSGGEAPAGAPPAAGGAL